MGGEIDLPTVEPATRIAPAQGRGVREEREKPGHPVSAWGRCGISGRASDEAGAALHVKGSDEFFGAPCRSYIGRSDCSGLVNCVLRHIRRTRTNNFGSCMDFLSLFLFLMANSLRPGWDVIISALYLLSLNLVFELLFYLNGDIAYKNISHFGNFFIGEKSIEMWRYKSFENKEELYQVLSTKAVSDIAALFVLVLFVVYLAVLHKFRKNEHFKKIKTRQINKNFKVYKKLGVLGIFCAILYISSIFNVKYWIKVVEYEDLRYIGFSSVYLVFFVLYIIYNIYVWFFILTGENIKPKSESRNSIS
ncbi:hypothetical protein T8K17_01390 [Thalassobaculum sp. OXR-137]|uniref:hypothetical protein n=1 Tax=Thalassobaculum sp. OXR-137 TaxID=3100173 RepID=UPI002AC8B0B6|nr:hypothetical protein [Thalassobaculum sp. OXR-137]WPZ34802.1 hypothetical protein T8K17_01390 [Thalassobaculum sp. OXR-137]